MDARGFWRLPAVALAGLLLSSCASTPSETAEPGTGSRTLAQEEVDGLLLGRGMGMAAAAEINGYPGPMHVLEMKDELALTPDQRFATSRLLGLVQGQTRALGQRIINAERQLDEAMAKGDMKSSEMRSHVQGIAALRGQLRFLHLDAHLQQKKILTPEQIARYYELRGREVIVPPPHTPAAPTEPLVLPHQEAEPAPVAIEESAAPTPDTPPSASPALPVPSANADPVTETSSEGVDATTLDIAPEAVPVENITLPEDTAPAMTPGMQDAVEDAEAVTNETIEVEPAPAPSEESVPAEASAPTPGMQDAMEEPETVANEAHVVDVAPVAEPAPVIETSPALPQDPAPAEAPALTPGMQDAIEEAAPADDAPPPLPAKHDAAAPANLAPLEEPGAPNATQPRALTTAVPMNKVSAGAQDAMELAAPADEDNEEAIYMTPLEDAPLEDRPPVESSEPATIELDN